MVAEETQLVCVLWLQLQPLEPSREELHRITHPLNSFPMGNTTLALGTSG
jgi:hypothetical protein